MERLGVLRHALIMCPDRGVLMKMLLRGDIGVLTKRGVLIIEMFYVLISYMS